MAKALVGFAKRLIYFALCLFVPARSVDFWQAWVFLILFALLFSRMIVHLAKNDPALLERRSTFGPMAEKRTSQKIVMVLLSIFHGAMLVTAGLDHYFHWSQVPMACSIVAFAGVLIGFFIQGATFRANSFASAVIKTMPGQIVISTGPYATVRHPMYSGSVVVNTCLPIALGSWRALPLSVVVALVLAMRILDEEKMLRGELAGYGDYCGKVRWRLVPGVW